jgi:hypothetical protein
MIFDELDARLGAVEGVESYERMPSGDPARFDALELYDGGEEAIEGEASTTRLALEIVVQGYVEDFGGTATHDRMADLHARVVSALCGDAGTNLGGLVENIEISGSRRVDVPELAKKRRLGFAQDFTIIYATPRGDPSQFA